MKRDLIKTASYGTMHMMVAMAVAFALTGDLAVAIGIGLLEPLVQTIFYNLHERAWSGRLFRRIGGRRSILAGLLGLGGRGGPQPVATS